MAPDASLHLAVTDVPEPDLYIIEGGGSLEPVELSAIRLIVEIADDSLRHDLKVKPALYASYAAPEYWVVDVHARVTHVHQGPDRSVYRRLSVTPFDSVLHPAFRPELGLRIADLPYLS